MSEHDNEPGYKFIIQSQVLIVNCMPTHVNALGMHPSSSQRNIVTKSTEGDVELNHQMKTTLLDSPLNCQ